jgi:MtN3 and saliva related transmembrane protein
MSWIDLCGYMAAALTTGAYLPQLAKAWRTRSTSDLSLGTLTMLVAGLGLWLTYGLARGDLPLVLANAVTLLLAGTVLTLKLRHG